MKIDGKDELLVTRARQRLTYRERREEVTFCMGSRGDVDPKQGVCLGSRRRATAVYHFVEAL